jgi:hypothetical protein
VAVGRAAVHDASSRHAAGCGLAVGIPNVAVHDAPPPSTRTVAVVMSVAWRCHSPQVTASVTRIPAGTVTVTERAGPTRVVALVVPPSKTPVREVGALAGAVVVVVAGTVVVVVVLVVVVEVVEPGSVVDVDDALVDVVVAPVAGPVVAAAAGRTPWPCGAVRGGVTTTGTRTTLTGPGTA